MKSKMTEVTEKITTYFKEAGAGSCKVKWSDTAFGANATCRVELTRYYDLGSVMSFAHMKWLSDLLHTEKINIEDQMHHDGCDTCDWGASDEGALVAYECDPLKDLL